jgi:hypothetical protein
MSAVIHSTSRSQRRFYSSEDTEVAFAPSVEGTSSVPALVRRHRGDEVVGRFLKRAKEDARAVTAGR